MRDQSDSAPPEPPREVPQPPPALLFEHQGALNLAPGEVRTIVVKGEPPARYEISFALLGQVLDASFDKTKVTSDSSGVASVNLRAPSSATEFSVLASIKDGPSIELDVTVAEKGLGSLRVVPVYNGKREAKEWVASAFMGTSCKALDESKTDEPTAEKIATAPFSEQPLIEALPVGPNVAVVLRAGKSIWGCADERGLKTNEVIELKVPVVNTPMNLLATNLDVTFEFDPAPGAYGDILKDAALQLTSAALPLKSEEASVTLLDAMQKATEPNTDAFIQARTTQGWDAIAAQHLAALPVSLHDQVTAWVEGSLVPQDSPSPPKLLMSGTLSAVGDAPGKAQLFVRELGGIDGEAAGVPGMHVLSWTADASDTVFLNGPIFWLPTRFAGATALIAAKAAIPNVTSMADALSEIVGCGELAAALGGHATCDTSCVAELCKQGLASRWEAGLDASGNAFLAGQIAISSASGQATVNEDAVPVAFSAAWLGAFTNGVIQASVAGTVTGEVPTAEGN